MNNRNKTMHYIRILVSFYLLYLSYQIVGGLIKGEEGTSPLMLIAVAFFVAASVYLILVSTKALKQIAREEKEEAELMALEQEEGAAEPVITPDEPAAPMSLSQRANLVKEAAVPEEDETEEAAEERKEEMEEEKGE